MSEEEITFELDGEELEEEFEDEEEIRDVVKVPPRIELKISNTTLNAEISIWDHKTPVEDLKEIALYLLQNSVKIVNGGR